FAWKDATVVLFLSTIHNSQNYIAKLRKQPSTISTGYRQTAKVFGDKARKELDIPDFIEEYNLFMCGVDVADQLRSYYNTERTYRKTWKPLFSFLLDIVVGNCYQLSTYRIVGERTLRQHSHAQFRRNLRDALLYNSICVRKQYTQPVKEHKLAKVFKKQHFCAACKEARRTTTTPHYGARKPLANLSINTTRKERGDSHGWKRRIRTPRTNYGCTVYMIAFCTGLQCWSEHLAKLNSIE
ncbi:uncharacterized protein BDZ99DRAFT_467143, partial [Mytilinidion resinicola]